MNYNHELMKEFKKAGIKAHLYKIKPEQKGTPADWRNLHEKLQIKSKENEEMLVKSIQYSKEQAVL